MLGCMLGYSLKARSAENLVFVASGANNRLIWYNYVAYFIWVMLLTKIAVEIILVRLEMRVFERL